MKAQHKTSTEFEHFLENRLHYYGIREYLVDRNISKNRLEQAIELLKSGLLVGKVHPEIMNGYEFTLKRIYKLIGDDDSYE